jgi:hypothetical protein
MSGWRLPTKDELNLMYENLYKKGLGGLADDFYWSSSEYDAYVAWYHYSTNGYQSPYSKSNSFRARAVHDFESDANLGIGEGAEAGIVFSKDGNKYVECAFEDLKIDDKIKFTWDEVMNYLKEDDAKKSDPMLMTGGEVEFLSTCAEENVKKESTCFEIKRFYTKDGVPTSVNVKLVVNYVQKNYEVLTGYRNNKFTFCGASIPSKRLAVIEAIKTACEYGEKELRR